jgi:PilZ domain
LRRLVSTANLQHMESAASPVDSPIAQVVPTDSPAERRKAVRYRLEVPLVFRWRGPGNSRQRGDGMTRDISAKGAYAIGLTAPPVHARVDVEVYLLGFREPKARIKARMKVSRVDHRVASPGRLGFSLMGNGFQLLSGQVRDRA